MTARGKVSERKTEPRGWRCFCRAENGRVVALCSTHAHAVHEALEMEEKRRREEPPTPIPMILTCPSCGVRHVDEGEFATKPHHTHACQHCGLVWRPAIVPNEQGPISYAGVGA